MATLNYNPPLVVDLTAYLAAKGVDIPNAKIKIYSAYHIGRNSDLEPGRFYLMLGENGWNGGALMYYGAMLANYFLPQQIPTGITPAQWYYNQCNFAMREAIQVHECERQS